jgi:hypothetical protein
MKAIKTTYNNITQSYYLVCRNNDNKYQLIAIPYGRIDERIFNSEEDAFNYLTRTIAQRNWEVKWTTISWRELKNNKNQSLIEYYISKFEGEL